jgi:SRF-type transcription factor (DNA-binding and dimerisation domain)
MLLRRKGEDLGRRKVTLFKIAHELGEYYSVEAAVITHQNGPYFT